MAYAAHYDMELERVRLQAELARARTPEDSLKLLYDLFDVEDRTRKRGVGLEIYEVATRTQRYGESLDILRNLAGFISDERLLNQLLANAKDLPESRDRDQTVLFIRMKIMSAKSRRMTYPQQQMYIRELMDSLLKHPDKKFQQDIDSRIFDLYTVVAMLRNENVSPMLIEYVDSLNNLAHDPRLTSDAIRNLIFSETANIYTDVGMPAKAIKADEYLLKVITDLESRYRKMGRNFRNYETNRYISYRRMMRNYKGMSPEDADRVQSRLLELSAINKEIKADMMTNATTPYYLMAKGKNAEAIPLIRKRLSGELPNPSRRQLLDMLRDAAIATGDTATLLEAIHTQNVHLTEATNNNAELRYKELQTAYDISTLRHNQDAMKIQMAEEETASLKRSMVIMVALWIVILVLLIILILYWSRYRRHSFYLQNFAYQIRKQRDKLKRSRYYDATRGGEDEDYSGINPINENHPGREDAENILQEIISDLLYISATGNIDRDRYIESVNLRTLLADTTKTAEKEMEDDDMAPNLVVENTPDDIELTTDVECLRYMLSHIMRFATLHAGEHGTATMRTVVNSHDNEVQFVFSHSGRRIDSGKEERLFSDIVDLRELQGREDSAMFVCRLNAFLMRCRLSYNPHRDWVAELLFTAPISLNGSSR